MKRSKFLVGALALSVALLGTGYAAWNDTLLLETTVDTATLDMDYDVKVSDTESTSSNTDTEEERTITIVDPLQYKAEGAADDTKIVTASATIGSTQVDGTDQDEKTDGTIEAEDTLTFSIANLYPTAGVIIPITVQNVGEIPAQLEDIAGVTRGVDKDSSILDKLLFEVKDESFNTFSEEAQMVGIDALNTQVQEAITTNQFNPGQEKTIYLGVKMATGAENNTQDGAKDTSTTTTVDANFSLTMKWNQANVKSSTPTEPSTPVETN